MESSAKSAVFPMLSVAGIVIIACYIGAQMIADVGSLKIAMVWGFSVDGGTFIYPFTFTLRDLVHKRLGKKAARTIVIVAAVINLVMALFFWIVSILPQDPAWGLGAEFSMILGPVWHIVIASIIAELVGELLDTEIYHLWRTRVTRRYQWLRVLVSNAVSVPVDTFIFVLIAFAFFLPIGTVLEIFLFNIIVKYAVTVISMPAIYLVKESPPD